MKDGQVGSSVTIRRDKRIIRAKKKKDKVKEKERKRERERERVMHQSLTVK